MLFSKFLYGYLSLFLMPTLFLLFKYKNVSKSVLLSGGLFLSFLYAWLIFLIGYALELTGLTIIFLLTCFNLYVVVTIFKDKNRPTIKVPSSFDFVFLYILVIILSFVMYNNGSIYLYWDALVSWNRWAIELFNNTYNPLSTAYPVLYPGIWSLLYKIQGTSDIWWTAKMALYVAPIYALFIGYYLFKESNDFKYVYILLFTSIVVITKDMYIGYMDMPVLLFGLVSLTVLIASEDDAFKNNRVLLQVLAILIASIATLTKQAGLFFLITNYVYILFFSKGKTFKDNKWINISFVISLVIIGSYMLLFFSQESNPIGNLNYLKDISYQNSFHGKSALESFLGLFNTYYKEQNIHFLGKGLSSKPYMIVSILALIGVIVSILMLKYIENKKVVLFLLLCFITSFLVWAKFHSYDARNAFYTHAYLIVIASIGYAYLLKKLAGFKKYVLPFLLCTIAIVSMFYSDKKIYNKQKQRQENVGNKEVAMIVSQQLKGSNACSKVYANDQIIKYNFHLNKYYAQVKQFSTVDIDFILNKYFIHSCDTSNYWVLLPETISSDKARQKISNLINENKIRKLSDKHHVYEIFPTKDSK